MDYALQLLNITKTFPGVKALDNVQLKVETGTVMGLIGENGAGKSTLMKVLGGVHAPDSGSILVYDQEFEHITPSLALKLGIGFVHQELNVCEDISVLENIYMGRILKNKYGVVDNKTMLAETMMMFDELGIDIDPNMKIKNLTTASKQMVEIVKSLSFNAKIIIFDEPTTSLTLEDVDNLFKIIKKLKKKNVSIIYISHRLNELFEICDNVTVLRDGQYIDCISINELNQEILIQKMVGRSLDDLFPKETFNLGQKRLIVDKVSDTSGFLKDLSFYACSGEIVGFAGLVGSGRTETMRLLFGADNMSSGKVMLDEKVITCSSPSRSIDDGIALITEDRRNQGLVTSLSIEENINLTNLPKFKINKRSLNATAINYVKILDIKARDIFVKVKNLSGGNQQKVVIAKWLNTDSEVYIFDEPTKGIDVLAKTEIYLLMNKLVESGKVVIMISSEMAEVLGMSDRIYVMREGRITGEFDRKDATQEKIMYYATKEEN